LPANLLLSDEAAEWLKAGVPIVLQHDLMTAHSLIAGLAQDEAGAIQGSATRILRTSVESRQGGLHIESTLADAVTHKVVKVESVDASSTDQLLPALNSLAKKIDPDATPFSTNNQQAWQSYVTSQGSNDPQQRAQFLNQAIGQDPNFGFAWVTLLEMIAPNRQTDVKNMIDEGKSHRKAFGAYDRAKFDLAMNRLTNAAPAEQIRSAQQTLALAPNDLDALTMLGSYQILAGAPAAGEESLRRAVTLNPANIGLRFQLARGLLELRKYQEAEATFSSIEKTPAVYPEMATCVLLEGDKTRAATISEKFVASVQNDELKALLRAYGEVISGDRQKGIDLVMDYAGAQKTVAMLSQAGSQAATLVGVASLLADKTSSAADWQKKVEAAALPQGVREPILAYGFFLRGNYAEAVTAWQRVDDTSHGMDLHARAMLASSLDHLGKQTEAQRIAVLPFAAEFSDLYSAISFTEMRRMLPK
jgi:Flp pilus assembly protein TadD